MESEYKVYYFNGNGRAANIRAILTHAGANWSDAKVSFEDWPVLKSTGKFLYGQMPGVEIDGKMYNQTIAIEVMLARRFNLLGKSDMDEYEILALLTSREDYSKKLAPLFFPTEEQKSKMTEIVKSLVETDLPAFLKIYEKKYNELSGKYFLGDNYTLADIFLATTFEMIFWKDFNKATYGHLPDQYAPKLSAHLKKIQENEMAGYFAKVYIKDTMF
jgi:glutathione S-transferase